MNRSNDITLKQAIRELLRVYGLEEKMHAIELVQAWEEVMGKTIARHTTNIHYKKKLLTVSIDSAPLRQELYYMRLEIIARLNEYMGKVLVEELKLK